MDYVLTISTPPGYVQSQITAVLMVELHDVAFLGFSDNEAKMHFGCFSKDLKRLSEVLDMIYRKSASREKVSRVREVIIGAIAIFFVFFVYALARASRNALEQSRGLTFAVFFSFACLVSIIPGALYVLAIFGNDFLAYNPRDLMPAIVFSLVTTFFFTIVVFVVGSERSDNSQLESSGEQDG